MKNWEKLILNKNNENKFEQKLKKINFDQQLTKIEFHQKMKNPYSRQKCAKTAFQVPAYKWHLNFKNISILPS